MAFLLMTQRTPESGHVCDLAHELEEASGSHVDVVDDNGAKASRWWAKNMLAPWASKASLSKVRNRLPSCTARAVKQM
jgi:hypothetical protein